MALADPDGDGQSHARVVVGGALVVGLAGVPQTPGDGAARLGYARVGGDAGQDHRAAARLWDAGIRGPDFVWAATGPALEVYSQHPVVKKTNEPGQALSVSEFLRHVRRMVADFVVGRVLSHDGGMEAVSGLDDVTTYYLLHRYNFGMASVPIGPCILYAVSCGLSDHALINRCDLLAKTGGQEAEDDEDESADGEV